MTIAQQRATEPERRDFIVVPDDAIGDYDTVTVEVILKGPIEVVWQGYYIDYKNALDGAHRQNINQIHMLRFPMYDGADRFAWININEIVTISVSRVNPEDGEGNTE